MTKFQGKWKQKETYLELEANEFSRAHNEEGELEEFDTHRTY